MAFFDSITQAITGARETAKYLTQNRPDPFANARKALDSFLPQFASQAYQQVKPVVQRVQQNFQNSPVVGGLAGQAVQRISQALPKAPPKVEGLVGDVLYNREKFSPSNLAKEIAQADYNVRTKVFGFGPNLEPPTLPPTFQGAGAGLDIALKNSPMLARVGNAALGQAGKIKLGPDTPVFKAASILGDIVKGFKAGREIKQTTNVGRQAGVRTQVIDKLSPVFDLVQKAGKELPAEINPYKKMRLYAGVSGQIEASLEKGLGPVLKKEADRLDDLSSMLVLERSIELQKRGIPTRYGAKQTQQAIEELADKYGPEGLQTLRESAKQVRTYGDSLLTQLKDSGIISKTSYNAIRKNNQFYTPFEIVEKLADNLEKGNFARPSFNVSKQDIIKTIKGSEKELGDPLEALVRRASKVITLSQKNQAMQSLVNLRNVDDVYKDLIIPLKTTKAPVTFTRKGKQVTQVRDVNQVAPKGMEVVTLLEDGTAKSYAVAEDVAAAIKNLDAQSSNVLVDVLSWQAKLLRAGATSLNIGFIPANVIRDVADAIFGTYTEKGAKAVGQLIASYPKAIASAISKDDLYQKWLQAGGSQVTLTSQLFKKTPQTVKELAGKKGLVKTVLSSPKSVIEFVNRVGEESTRLARFKAGLKTGESVAEAAYRSRDVTVDFAKSGNLLKVLNTVVPFLNANVQGVERMFRLAKNNPGRAAVGIGTMVGFPSTLLYLNNRQFQDYKDIPQYEKDSNWIIIARDRTEEEKANGDPIAGIKIPKGHLLMPFSNIADAFLQYVDQNEPQSLTDLAMRTFEQVSPVGIPGSGKFFSATLPPGFQAGIETATNRNLFTGAPIVNRGLENLEPGQQYNEKTPKILVSVGQLLGVSPLHLQNIIETTTGGTGKQLTQLASGNVKEATVDTVLKRFQAKGGKQTDDFYDVLSKSKVVKATATKLANSSDPNAATYVEEHLDDLVKNKALAKIESKVSELKKKKLEITASKELTGDEKTNLLRAVNLTIEDLVKLGVDIDKNPNLLQNYQE